MITPLSFVCFIQKNKFIEYESKRSMFSFTRLFSMRMHLIKYALISTMGVWILLRNQEKMNPLI